MKINARLKKIGDLVEANSFCLDIGCDHALLDIYLVTQKKNIKAIASDIAEGPLEHARKNIKRERLENEIEVNGKISSLLELGTAFNMELTGEENIYQHGQVMGLTDEQIKVLETGINIGECITKPAKAERISKK